MKGIKQLKLVVLIATLSATSDSRINAQVTYHKNQTMASFTDKEKAAPKEYLTGTVWVNMNVTPDDGYNTNIGTVTFEKNASTNWHSHTSGQLLFAIEGVGLYQEKGKPIQLIEKGDVVKIPKNAVHWHGASYGNSMRHIAMITDHDKDKTDWYQPVSDEEYNSYKPAKIVEQSKANVTEAAHKNHEALWPGYQSKAKQTDPDLIEVFDNFAFDEVINHNTMDTKTRVLMIMASTIGSQALQNIKCL